MPKKQFSSRCNPEVYEELKKIAKQMDRSLAWVIEDAFKNYIGLPIKRKDGSIVRMKLRSYTAYDPMEPALREMIKENKDE